MASTIGKTLLLRSAIQTKLSTHVTNTFYQKTKDTFNSVWCIYNFDQVTDDENLTQYRLVVELLSIDGSTIDIENKADEIWGALDHWYYRDTNMAFTTYPDLRNNISEEDKLLNHRRLVFTLKLYK